MMLTYNIRHNLNLNKELEMARAVAKLAVEHGYTSSKQVKLSG